MEKVIPKQPRGVNKKENAANETIKRGGMNGFCG